MDPSGPLGSGFGRHEHHAVVRCPAIHPHAGDQPGSLAIARAWHVSRWTELIIAPDLFFGCGARLRGAGHLLAKTVRLVFGTNHRFFGWNCYDVMAKAIWANGYAEIGGSAGRRTSGPAPKLAPCFDRDQLAR